MFINLSTFSCGSLKSISVLCTGSKLINFILDDCGKSFTRMCTCVHVCKHACVAHWRKQIKNLPQRNFSFQRCTSQRREITFNQWVGRRPGETFKHSAAGRADGQGQQGFTGLAWLAAMWGNLRSTVCYVIHANPSATMFHSFESLEGFFFFFDFGFQLCMRFYDTEPLFQGARRCSFRLRWMDGAAPHRQHGINVIWHRH